MFWCQIPEPEVAIHGIHIDPDGAYLAAVNSKVRQCCRDYEMVVIIGGVLCVGS